MDLESNEPRLPGTKTGSRTISLSSEAVSVLMRRYTFRLRHRCDAAFRPTAAEWSTCSRERDLRVR